MRGDLIDAGILNRAECQDSYISAVQECERLERCEEQIKAELAAMKMVRQRIDSDLKRFRNAHSPAISLPTELISAILISGLPDLPRDTSAWPQAKKHYLRAVTSVCHWWREVALHTPPLWESFWSELHYPEGEPYYAKSELYPAGKHPRLPDCFQESCRLLSHKKTLLDAHLDIPYEPKFFDSDIVPPLFALFPFLDFTRVRALDLVLYTCCKLTPILLSQGLPQLSHLKLRVQSDEETPKPLPMLSAPPNLKHLILEFWETFPTPLSLYYAGLASNATYLHLQISGRHKDTLLMFLEHARMVEELVLKETEYSWGEYEPSTVVDRLELPRLKTLSYSPYWGLDVFSRLKLPALESLEMYSAKSQEVPTDTADSLPALCSASSRSTYSSSHIIRSLGSHHFPIQSLNLRLDLPSCEQLCQLLSERDTSATRAYLHWNSLSSLSVTLDFWNYRADHSGSNMSVAQNLVTAILPRSGLSFVVRVGEVYHHESESIRAQRAQTEAWVNETKERLGDRFSYDPRPKQNRYLRKNFEFWNIYGEMDHWQRSQLRT